MREQYKKERKIKKYALILFMAVLAGYLIWSLDYGRRVSDRSREVAAAADLAIARSEASLGRR